MHISDTVPSLVATATAAIAVVTYALSNGNTDEATQSNHRQPPGKRQGHNNMSFPNRREKLKHVAEVALKTIRSGKYDYRGATVHLEDALTESTRDTKFWGENSELEGWSRNKPAQDEEGTGAHISILNISTTDASQLLERTYRFLPPNTERPKIGVLNFASATKPGGGFKNGAEAQEESIARVSTLSSSLQSKKAAEFYRLHDGEKGKHESELYTHSMIWSPSVVVFLTDDATFIQPYKIEVISCAAVNAKEVLAPSRSTATRAERAAKQVVIEKEMMERMGRILYLFECMGIRDIVLGTFGTGVFQNHVSVVARLWAKLLSEDDARFKHSFDRVIFAITGDETFGEFHVTYEAWRENHKPGYNRVGRKSRWPRS